MRLHVLSVALLLLAAAPATAATPSSARIRALLARSGSPAELRARLLAYADSAVAAGDAVGASEAFGHAGESFRRETRPDSAILCQRRALELESAEPRLFALADQLLLRGAPADLAEAVGRLEAARTPAVHPQILGRLAWSRFLQGRPDTADAIFAPIAQHLLPHPEWRYRMARVALERRDYRRAGDLLLPNAVRTRGTDDEVVGMLQRIGDAAEMTERLQQEVRRQVLLGDRPLLDLARQLGGSLVTFDASDGFTLGGLLLPAPSPARSRRPLLAIVLLAPSDSLPLGDSLAVALRRHGITSLLLHPRGSGLSAGPFCPSPESWFDREALLQARVARDVGEAARWAAAGGRVDTTRYLVVGVRASAPMAVEAATLDPRVKALLLVSPLPALVDWGTMAARLGRLRLPVFFQIGADDLYDSFRLIDPLYQAGDRGASRVVESHMPGSGLAQFRHDPRLAQRFLEWLDAAFKPRGRRGSPPPTRPAPPPPG